MGKHMTDTIGAKLGAIVGRENVLIDPSKRTFYSTDLSHSGATASAVVSVSSSAQLSSVAALCSAVGIAMIPRGGGFSYTGGYTPVSESSVIVDLRSMNRILEINEQDLYVRVEAGCTWERLYQALKKRGLRTPYFGPMSGFNATVGGALSQGSFFMGSTEYGTVMESVLSVEVVLANGDVVHTGSDSASGVAPFYRNYGPDLTGMFLADTGALGFKTVATLKLIEFPSHQAYASFTFDRGEDALAALSAIGRKGIAAEAYVWDPFFVEVMSTASTGFKQDLAFLGAVVRNSGGLIDGMAAAARIAIAGKSVFKLGSHMLHVIIDDHSAVGAAHRLKTVRKLAIAQRAQEVAPSVPRALRGTPFTNFNVAERRSLRRNLPVNSLYPHSRVGEAQKQIWRLFETERPEMKSHDVTVGTVYFAVGRNAVCIEPLLYWDDPVQFQHNRVNEVSDINELARLGDPSPATNYVQALRSKLRAVMQTQGAVHVQIGKMYNFLTTREPRVAELVRQIKGAVDPEGLVNPGSLGL